MKNSKWLVVKEMLFAYLAVSKIFYWLNYFADMQVGETGGAILERILNQDIIIIASVIIFFFLEKFIYMKKNSKYDNIITTIKLYSAAYIALIGFLYLYLLILSLFLPIEFPDFWTTVGSSMLGFVVIAFLLNIKYALKFKKVEDKNIDDKLTMLEVLLKDGILNQEEFNQKKKMLQTV
ncbi:MAG: hypothetical protein FWE36_05425 [Erysipelotrichales bacterium]|nr:hypothetical protein [Erysipelotrichales bacterium]